MPFWEKDETETFALRQMCIDPVSQVTNVGLFLDNKVVIGWTSGEFAIYESYSELPIRVIDSIQEGLTAFAVSPDSNVLVAGYTSGLIAIYSLTGAEQLHQIRDEVNEPISEIVFSDDSKTFAVVTNNGKVVTSFVAQLIERSETGRTNELLRQLHNELKKSNLEAPFVPSR